MREGCLLLLNLCYLNKISVHITPQFNQTGKLTSDNFKKLNIKKILQYMDFLKNNSPRHRFRFSQQTWLQQDKTADPVLRQLHER